MSLNIYSHLPTEELDLNVLPYVKRKHLKRLLTSLLAAMDVLGGLRSLSQQGFFSNEVIEVSIGDIISEIKEKLVTEFIPRDYFIKHFYKGKYVYVTCREDDIHISSDNPTVESNFE